MTNVVLDTGTLAERYKRQTRQSLEEFQAARQLIPGGLSRDSIRRMPHPIYVQRAAGKYVWDLDGNRYLDFCMNNGSNLLGHCPPAVVEGVRLQAEEGFGVGAPTHSEIEAARRIKALYPGADQVSLTNSGSAAVLQMLRAARAFTGRRRIVIFEGAYHGSPGTAQKGLHGSTDQDMLTIAYNDAGALATCFAAYPDQIAGVMVDPCIDAWHLPQAADGFLRKMAELAHANGALLLFDEVVSGFRYAPGGAQEVFGVRPDLVSFGKCLGGGMPLGAVAGRADIMAVFGPDKRAVSRVPPGDSLNVNPLTLAATLAFLEYVDAHPGLHPRLNALGSLAREELAKLGERYRVPLITTGAQSMFQVHVGMSFLPSQAALARRDVRFRQHLYLYLATHGMYTPVSGPWFIAEPHTEEDIRVLVESVAGFLEEHYMPLWGKRVRRLSAQ